MSEISLDLSAKKLDIFIEATEDDAYADHVVSFRTNHGEVELLLSQEQLEELAKELIRYNSDVLPDIQE